MSQENSLPGGISIAIIGCGKLGTSLLQGFLCPDEPHPKIPQSSQLISRIFVTVRQSTSLKRIQQTIASSARLPTPQVIVQLQSYNGQAVRDADVVILGCKPSSFKELLGDSELRQGLLESVKRKTFISILGGITIQDLENTVYQLDDQSSIDSELSLRTDDHQSRCLFIRAIPNIAARTRESMTVLSLPSSSLDDEDGNMQRALCDSLFKCIGLTRWVVESQMNHASALCASALAFYADLIAAAAEGARGNGDGLSQEDAIQISAQAARGASSLILAGEDPKQITMEVATKGGSTMAGLTLLGERETITAVRDAVKETATATKALATALR